MPSASRSWRTSSSWLSIPAVLVAELLLAGRQHGLEPLEVACALALKQGTVTAAVILNHLHRLLSPPQPETLPIPARLRLTLEPVADCARYDRLRPTEVSPAR